MKNNRSSKVLFRYPFALLLLSAGAFALWTAMGSQTHGATAPPVLYIVDSTGDGDNVSQVNTVCDDGTGHCTLRAAIEASNSHVGADTIAISIPTTDPGYSKGVWTINLTKSLPDISDSVSIGGPGATKLIIDARGVAFIRILNVTTAGTVSVSGLTIANAYVGLGVGAGINNANGGAVNIINCTLSGNQSDDNGGGIYNASNGTVNVANSILRFNRAGNSGATGDGGGVFNVSGAINVSNSSFDHNESGDSGGGILNSGGTVTVSGSSFYENGASVGGGIASKGGTLSVTNSTFYANIAYEVDLSFDRGFGGAIANFSTSVLNLTNSTIVANFSNRAGSGIVNDSSSGAIANVKSTIIALNYGGASPSQAAPDVSGAFSSKGFNLIGKKDGSTGFNAGTDEKGTIKSPLDPKVDPLGLGNNGGPTKTIALLPGSPAIDAGTSVGLTGKLTTDQRGQTRTFDNTAVTNASGGDGTDIGAYERETP